MPQQDKPLTDNDVLRGVKRAKEAVFAELTVKVHEGRITRIEVRPVEIIKADVA